MLSSSKWWRVLKGARSAMTLPSMRSARNSVHRSRLKYTLPGARTAPGCTLQSRAVQYRKERLTQLKDWVFSWHVSLFQRRYTILLQNLILLLEADWNDFLRPLILYNCYCNTQPVFQKNRSLIQSASPSQHFRAGTRIRILQRFH